MEMERVLQLADEIYIFPIGSTSGIKFYDRTPDKVVQELTGTIPEGVFHTDEHSIADAEWDDRVNQPNQTIMVKYVDGSNRVTTYIVTEEKYREILETIGTPEKRSDGIIVIDTREKEIKKGLNLTPKDIAEAAKKDNITLSEVKNANNELVNNRHYENLLNEPIDK